jgi:sugar phosphate isomerase/epimerase
MASVALGVSIIERHITLDKRMVGPDHAASLDPQQMIDFVVSVRKIELAMGGNEKHLSRIVIRNKETLGKSLVAKNNILKGSVITRNDVTVKGPAKGVSPLMLYSLLGKVATRDFVQDDFFSESDFVANSNLDDYKPNFKSRWGFKGRFLDLDYYNEKYSPRFVEIHLNDKDLDFNFKAHFGKKTFPFDIILHYPTYWQRKVVDLACENESDRKLFVEVVQRVINMALEIKDHFTGTPGVVVHMGGMDIVEKKDNSNLLKLAYKSMNELDYKGVIFYAENNPPRPWYFSGQWYDNAFCSPYEMVDFSKNFNVPMCFDFSHAKLYCNLTGFDFYKYIEIVAPVTRHLHICDAYGIDGEGMQIGDGDIDFSRAFKVLREFGDVENMSWTPEIWQGHNNKAAGFIEGFLRLKSLSVLS